MSVCKAASSGGRKRRHEYAPGTNRCVKCGHVTTHGKIISELRKPKEEE